MAGADSRSRIAMEVLVERQQVAPVWIGLEELIRSEYGPLPAFIAAENADKPARYLVCGILQIANLSGARRAFDFEVSPIVLMKPAKRLDQQVVHRQPDGAAPVGVAAKQAGRRFAGFVVHRVLDPSMVNVYG